MVPGGKSCTHGHTRVFIIKDRHITGCHISSDLMEKLDSLTWTQGLLHDKNNNNVGLTFSWLECLSIRLTRPLPSVSRVIYHPNALWAKPSWDMVSCSIHQTHLRSYCYYCLSGWSYTSRINGTGSLDQRQECHETRGKLKQEKNLARTPDLDFWSEDSSFISHK